MTFQDRLNEIIATWETGKVEDEWAFQKLRDDFVGAMRNDVAHAEVCETVRKLSVSSCESTATEIIETLLALAKQSDTTEVPAALLSCKTQLQDQFLNYGPYARRKLDDWFRYYRIDVS